MGKLNRLPANIMVGKMSKVLVIDDDPSLLRALGLALGASGHTVIGASLGNNGLVEIASAAPDVVVLDLGLPDMDGIEVCHRVRQFSDVPVIVLSADDDEKRVVAALDSGANDYIRKPFGMAELQARIRACLRDVPDVQADRHDPVSEVQIGRLSLDLVRHSAYLSGELLDLTFKEFEIIAFLARNVTKTVTHEMLLNAVWGKGYASESQYLHSYIHRLRKKIAGAGSPTIRTLPGIGYVLELPNEAATGIENKAFAP